MVPLCASFAHHHNNHIWRGPTADGYSNTLLKIKPRNT